MSSVSYNGVADNCIDGDVETGCHSNHGGEENPWLRVDLGTTKQVSEVYIYNRPDACGSRLGAYEIWLGLDGTMKQCASAGSGGDLSCREKTGAGPIKNACVGAAQYVELRLPGDARLLNIKDMAVYAS